jgi:hypothetical protein
MASKLQGSLKILLEIDFSAYGNTQITSLPIGIAQGLAAALGMIGSLSFPPLRRFIGLNAVGMLGLALEVRKYVIFKMRYLHHHSLY